MRLSSPHNLVLSLLILFLAATAGAADSDQDRQLVLVIFDLDGTLLDTMGDDSRLFIDSLRETAGIEDLTD